MNNRKLEKNSHKTESEIANQCADCGKGAPEYVVDDKRLCVDLL